MRELGRKGGQATVRNNPDHLRQIGAKGGEARKKKIDAAKGAPIVRKRKPKMTPPPEPPAQDAIGAAFWKTLDDLG